MTNSPTDALHPGILVPRGELSTPDAELIGAAESAAGHASPVFSKFSVGAALRTWNGPAVHRGWNVEDQSLSKVVHAEHSATVAANHAEGGPVRIQEIAIWGTGDVPPCGACRQMIFESNPSARILFPYRGQVLIATAADLLPLGFRISPAP
jgi:cytidine deaminase